MSPHKRDGILKWLATLAAIGLLQHPAAKPHEWHAPKWWLAEAVCIHEHEGAWNAATGNGYFGGMQFTLYTWRSVGGRGLPSSASPREQLHRAWLVYRRDGNSWREWGTAGACGLR